MAITQPYLRITNQTSSAAVSGVAVNIMNVMLTDSANVVTVANACITAIKNFYTSIATYLPSVWTAGQRVLLYIPGDTTPVIVGATPQSATSTGLPQAPQLAAVVSWRTPLAGPSFRGRTFLGPLNASAFNNNVFAGAFTTAANNGAATLITALAAAASTGNPVGGLVIHSATKDRLTLVTGAAVDTKVDTMRRRA